MTLGAKNRLGSHKQAGAAGGPVDLAARLHTTESARDTRNAEKHLTRFLTANFFRLCLLSFTKVVAYW